MASCLVPAQKGHDCQHQQHSKCPPLTVLQLGGVHSGQPTGCLSLTLHPKGCLRYFC